VRKGEGNGGGTGKNTTRRPKLLSSELGPKEDPSGALAQFRIRPERKSNKNIDRPPKAQRFPRVV